jgi:hypothetical protein
LFCVLLVVLYGGCGIGMAFMAMNLGGTVLQVIYIYIYRITSNLTVETRGGFRGGVRPPKIRKAYVIQR